MNVSDFDFELPPELIAQEPPAVRGASRLLAVDRQTGARAHRRFRDLPELLRPGDLLVANDTSVFPARLLGRRLPGGGAVECLLVAEEAPATATAVEGVWSALVHPGQRLKEGSRMEFPADGPVAIEGEILGRHFHGRRTVRLRTTGGGPLDEAIDRIGHVPLPPYIHRADAAADRERYQTVFAHDRGSIAAPTAGLHFTPELLAALDARGVERTTVTLHVGYGTFQPIRVDRVEDHQMEAERYIVSDATAAALTAARVEGRRIVAVGTTTTRTLESLNVAPDGTVEPGRGDTSLFIRPGHQFRLVTGLVTNFHLPRSSLLMLVSAFGGREHILAAYRDAVAAGYRFYSYGDAMLIL
ncbi:MAG: tRNA preQ1(34) S-adenosylmethionine ribosyltransferase-isomerase QueA [Vicinamibacterales bacterium]